jgi:MoaA/NifB/PqqE/SkfB family radical SAM enzyme
MHFTISGEVHACCQNGAYQFGDVRTDTLGEIWAGVQRHSMASALAGGVYPVGCEGCAVEHALGNRAATPAPPFDRFPLDDPEWPRQLEFTLSNRCNLACVQCNGDNSSTIRSKREGRPPLPMPYGDRFFEELVPFLDHVEVCAFLGGEPFLTPQAKRVWDLLIERGRSPVVQVTTNATVWNDQVERYLLGLRMDIALSIDGATAGTYEAIREGASYDRVVEIRDRMLAAARTYGGRVHLNYCLLRANWHEVGSILRQADELDVDANIIPVWAPPEHSLFTLPRAELGEVVEALDAESEVVGPTLGRNRPVWDATVGLLADHLARLGSVRSRDAGRARVAEEHSRRADLVAEQLKAELAAWAGRDCIDVRTRDGRVRAVQAPSWADPIRPETWVGIELGALPDAVAGERGSVTHGEQESDLVTTDGADVLVVRSASTLTSPDGEVSFRAVHISGVDRLFVAAAGSLAALGIARADAVEG